MLISFLEISFLITQPLLFQMLSNDLAAVCCRHMEEKAPLLSTLSDVFGNLHGLTIVIVSFYLSSQNKIIEIALKKSD